MMNDGCMISSNEIETKIIYKSATPSQMISDHNKDVYAN